MEYHYEIYRRFDDKSLGEIINYSRRGSGMPGPWHVAAFRCPSETDADFSTSQAQPSPAQHFAEANHMVSQYTEIKGMNITTSIDSYDTTPGKNDRVEFSRGITADQPYRQ